MAKTRESARKADVLKDFYVDQISDGRRLSPSAAQNPGVVGPSEAQVANSELPFDQGLTPATAQNPFVSAVSGPFEQQVASEHLMLDTGHRGYINDGDGRSYLYKDGKRFDKQDPSLANPIKGKPAGAKEYREMTPQEYEKYDRKFRDADKYYRGTGMMASGL